jgi:AcrR family transcriptional regulator
VAKKTTSAAAWPPMAKAGGRAGTRRAPGSAGARPVVSNAQRRETTRRAVLDAATECFDQAGYLATRLDDVTTRARLTKGAVYFHFGSKKALAEAVIQEQASYWPAVLDQLAGRPGTPLDHLIDLTYEVARSLRDNVSLRAGVRLSLDQDVPGVDPAQTLNRWSDTVADLLRKARRAGAIADHVVPAAAARFIVAAFLGAYHLASVVDGKPDARKRLDEFWSLALPQLTA